MKPIALPVLTAAVLLSLAACDSRNPEAPADTSTTSAPAERVPLPSASGTATVPTASSIPAAIQGRWGMVAADCEPGRDDAKGLMVVTANRLEFYESIGRLDEVKESSDTSLRAQFDFTGEGMEWGREVAMELLDNGKTLRTLQSDNGVSEGPFRYSKCP
jgi:hypothetical protein